MEIFFRGVGGNLDVWSSGKIGNMYRISSRIILGNEINLEHKS